jgi:hypothetical protein
MADAADQPRVPEHARDRSRSTKRPLLAVPNHRVAFNRSARDADVSLTD